MPYIRRKNYKNLEYINRSLKNIENKNNIIYLDYSNRNIYKLPLNIFKLINLKELNCEYNLLVKLSDLSIFTELELLNCSHNNLKTISTLSNLNNLKYLLCFNNNLIQLPKLCLLFNLIYLNCDNNKLIFIPYIYNLNNLISISCSNNRLFYLPKLPVSLCELNCDNNNLKSLPISILDCNKLNYCSYENNKDIRIPIQFIRYLIIKHSDNKLIKDISKLSEEMKYKRNILNNLSFELPLYDDILLYEMLDNNIINAKCKDKLLYYCNINRIDNILLLKFKEALWYIYKFIDIKILKDRQEIVENKLYNTIDNMNINDELIYNIFLLLDCIIYDVEYNNKYIDI